MVSSGRPIIATCRENSEIAHVVKQCGMVVPPEDPTALAQAIDLLSTQPEQRLEMGAQARHYADEHLSKQTILHNLVDQFQGLLPGPGRPDTPHRI